MSLTQQKNLQDQRAARRAAMMKDAAETEALRRKLRGWFLTKRSPQTHASNPPADALANPQSPADLPADSLPAVSPNHAPTEAVTHTNNCHTSSGAEGIGGAVKKLESNDLTAPGSPSPDGAVPSPSCNPALADDPTKLQDDGSSPDRSTPESLSKSCSDTTEQAEADNAKGVQG